MTRNNTGITRRDVPRDVASRSRLSGAGLHNATYCSCSTELKNRGNDTAAPETARGRKRATLQTPSLTYLTSLARQRCSEIFTNLPLPCRWIFTIAFCLFHAPCTLFPLLPPYTGLSRSPRRRSPQLPVQLSLKPSAQLDESGLARPVGAADLLRVCKLELKELSTSGNPREIYRRACFHE